MSELPRLLQKRIDQFRNFQEQRERQAVFADKEVAKFVLALVPYLKQNNEPKTISLTLPDDQRFFSIYGPQIKMKDLSYQPLGTSTDSPASIFLDLDQHTAQRQDFVVIIVPSEKIAYVTFSDRDKQFGLHLSYHTSSYEYQKIDSGLLKNLTTTAEGKFKVEIFPSSAADQLQNVHETAKIFIMKKGNTETPPGGGKSELPPGTVQFKPIRSPF